MSWCLGGGCSTGGTLRPDRAPNAGEAGQRQDEGIAGPATSCVAACGTHAAPGAGQPQEGICAGLRLQHTHSLHGVATNSEGRAPVSMFAAAQGHGGGGAQRRWGCRRRAAGHCHEGKQRCTKPVPCTATDNRRSVELWWRAGKGAAGCIKGPPAACKAGASASIPLLPHHPAAFPARHEIASAPEPHFRAGKRAWSPQPAAPCSPCLRQPRLWPPQVRRDQAGACEDASRWLAGMASCRDGRAAGRRPADRRRPLSVQPSQPAAGLHAMPCAHLPPAGVLAAPAPAPAPAGGGCVANPSAPIDDPPAFPTRYLGGCMTCSPDGSTCLECWRHFGLASNGTCVEVSAPCRPAHTGGSAQAASLTQTRAPPARPALAVPPQRP